MQNIKIVLGDKLGVSFELSILHEILMLLKVHDLSLLVQNVWWEK